MSTLEDVSEVNNERDAGPAEPKDKLNGLGGWLILVGIGVVITPFRLLAELVPLYVDVFRDNLFEILTSERSAFYHPVWKPYLYGEVIGGICILVGSLVLIYLFFSKNKMFPFFYIFLLIFNFIFIVLDTAIPSMIMDEIEFFNEDKIKDIVLAAGSIIIWVPYMKMSKRVKKTFVR